MEEARLYSNEELATLCPGLSFFPDFISPEEESALIEELDHSHLWDDRLSRRVQHYGFEFDYAIRKAIDDGKTTSSEFPPLCQSILRHLPARLSTLELNQLTVNEYNPGQGIGPHIDSHSCFGDTMLSISLLSNICIRFVPRSSRLPEGMTQRVNLWIPQRSLLIMEGPSRFAFSHCVPTRMTDCVGGEVFQRQRRISLTYRSIRVPDGCLCEFPDACESQDLVLVPTRIPARVKT